MSGNNLEFDEAFAALQEKQVDIVQKLWQTDAQIKMLNQNKQFAAFTEKELSSLEPETKTYELIGRMFVLTPIKQFKEDLQRKQVASDGKIQELEINKKYLENSLKETVNAMRDLAKLDKHI